MTETIEFYKECEKEVIGSVQGAYKVKRNYLENNYGEEKATKEFLKWGISQVEKGIGKHFTWKDAENSLREMSKIAIALADKCEDHLSIT